VLGGGSGLDVFRFNAPLDATTNVDRITDFGTTDDRIQLDDAVFTAVGAVGQLSNAAFRLGTAAADASDRIVYDSGTGQLWYDADGVGGTAAILFAKLAPGTLLSVDDFWVV